MPKASKQTKTKKRNKPRHNFEVKAKTPGQEKYIQSIEDNIVTLCSGLAGSGKTLIATGMAMKRLNENEGCRRIIIVRPAIEACGESLGYLPGDLDDKMRPFAEPIFDNLRFFVKDEGFISTLIETKQILISPMSHMRGRAQPYGSIVMTPNGPKCIENLIIGDIVLGSNGKETKVLDIFEQGTKEIYKITFSDGSSTECCAQHLWAVKSLDDKRRNKNWKIVQLKEIIGNEKNKLNQCVYEIPLLSEPFSFNIKDVPIDPYILGVLLGDGSLHEKASISLSTKDDFIVNEFKKNLPHGTSIVYRSGYDYAIVSKERRNILRSKLKTLGLIGTKSNNKFVPDIYKYNLFSIRLSVLQGLLDSDGWCGHHRSGKNRVQYYSTSEHLSNDVMWLVQSLGGTAQKRLKKVKGNSHLLKGRKVICKNDIYVLDIALPKGINPFRLPRKHNIFTETARPKRLISSIEFVGTKPARCIKIDAKDSLYLTDSFIVTHNTFNDCVVIFDEAQNATKEQMKMFLTRIGYNCRAIVEGDVTQSDIPGERQEDNGLFDAMKRLTRCPGVGVIKLADKDICRSKIVADILKRYK